MDTGTDLTDQDLDRLFHALADPTRRSILARLTEGEAGVMELAEPFAMSQPAITKHLQVLESAGLVSTSAESRRRPRRLEPDRLRQVSEWIGGYQEFWQESYDRLDAYLADLQTEKKGPDNDHPTA